MSERGRVKATSLNFRDAPNGKVLKSLSDGTVVEILAEADGWLRVSHEGEEGFVSSDYVERLEAQRTGRVTASSLNLRDAPDGEIIRSLPEGAGVRILEETGDWMKVEVEGVQGYVAKRYVQEGEGETPEEEAAPFEVPEGFRLEGRDVFSPDGTRFARTFRLGVFNSGETSIGDFVEANRAAFADLPDSKLNVMQAVSANEGNLEAINTWDNAFLTFGAFQWTVGTGNGAGELAAVLDRLREADGEAFGRLFGRFGLGIDSVTGSESEPPRGFFTLDGEMLRTPDQKERLRSIEWAYRFWMAGHDDLMRRVQIGHASGRVDLFYQSPQKGVRGRLISDYVTSEYGVALLLDQHVNRPGHVPKTLADAVDRYVEETGADNPENWGDGEEARLLQIYIELRNETSMTDPAQRAARTRKAVDDGLASDARGSYRA